VILNIYFVQSRAAHYNCKLFSEIAKKKNIDKVVVITRHLIGPVEKNLNGVDLIVRPGWIGFLLEVLRALTSRAGLIVFDGHSSFPASLFLCFAGKLYESNLVLWSLGAVPLRAQGFRSKIGDNLSKLYCSYSKFIICYGSHSKRYFLSLGVATDKLYVAQNALPHPEIPISDKIHNKDKASEEAKIVFIGALNPQKNIDLLVKVVACHPHIALDIIGDGPYLEELRSISFQCKADNVSFIGPLFELELSKRLNSYDFAVLPGLGGLAINSALSHGLPVICGPADGTEEDLVIDGHTGLLLDSVTFESLEAAILDFSVKLSKCHEMGKNGQNLISQKVTVEEQLKVFMHVFNQIGK